MEINIIDKLKTLRYGKNESYSILADYMLEINDIFSLKIKKVQEDCHVSSATVVRFCKELNLSGFSELKYKLDQEKKSNNNHININAELSKMANEHLDNLVNSYSNTRKLLKENYLDRVVKFIIEYQKINIYALGGTFLVAQDLELKLDRVKKYCKSYNDENLQYFSAKNSDISTLAIGITYSGKSKSVIKSLKISKEQGAKTIIITNEKNTHFEEFFDSVLYIDSTDSRNRLISTTSRLTMLYLIDLIYYSYMNIDSEYINKVLKYNSLE
ncbi:MurR/RpiR family transcriptional regulator [Clostridioides difficile]